MTETTMNFSDLIGKTLTKVEKGDDYILFTATDERSYRLYHSQDCCESVNVEDVAGDLDDLVGSPILTAEESTSNTDPDGYKRDYPPESVTWTFYRIGTIKGSVVIRFLGESNGYYSESVEFAEC
jgi:hypothetical protein